jgi:sugar transferase (PEP-CTERM/EpsH1 system associated)
MRILCLTSRLPYPPNRGDRLRAFHFIEHLSREHELSLVSFVAGEAERDHVAALETYCEAVHVVSMSPTRSAVSVASNLWRPDPLQVLYYRSGAMQSLIAEVTSRTAFDAAYVHLFRMAPYVEHLTGMYRIVDLTDVISKEISLSLPYRGLASRLLYRMEKPRIARYERWVAQTFEESWLISEADRKLLAAACPRANIRVVPNGVDLDWFHPTGQVREPNSLIFVGHMGVFHNIDAAIHLVTDVLPLVREQIPDCRLKIVGADPDPQIRRLDHDPSVTVTGFVPDLNEELNQAAVFVAPLRFAAGVQNKVLEAMAAGTPVVTTSLINEGLGAQADHELLVADDAVSTAEQIVLLLQDRERREQIGQAGRQFVVRNYRWTHVVERVRGIENRLAKGISFEKA